MSEADERRLAWHRRMLLIRVFEEKVQELFMSGQIEGTTHLCQGQEAVSVGAIAAMRPGDVQTNTYRGHGEALALGMDARGRLRRADGPAARAARRASAARCTSSTRPRATSAPTPSSAPGCPSPSGPRWPSSCAREPHVALTFFGDGATNIGTFHESLNMAAVWKAPGRLHHHQQPVRRVLAAAHDHAHRRPGPPRRPVRHARRHRGRPGRRGRPRRDRRGRRRGPGRATAPACSR